MSPPYPHKPRTRPDLIGISFASIAKKILLMGVIFLILITSGCLECKWYWRCPTPTPPPTTAPTTSPPTTAPPTTVPPTTTPPPNPDIVGSHSAVDRGFIGLLILYSLTIYFYSHRRYTQKSQYQKRFILRLAAFITLGYGLAQVLPTGLLQGMFPALSVSILSLLNIDSFAAGENLFIALREGGYYMIIVSPYCVGWGPISNYIALILSVPEIKTYRRLKGILYGLPIVVFFNFLKVPLEGLISYHYGTQPWITQIDAYFATGILVVVYFTWVAWIKRMFKVNSKSVLVSDSKNPVLS